MEANGGKVDFVPVRKCVSGDIAGVNQNSNCANVSIRIARLRLSGRGKVRRGKRKNREIFAIRRF